MTLCLGATPPMLAFCTWLAAGGQVCVMRGGVVRQANALAEPRHEAWKGVTGLMLDCTSHGTSRHHHAIRRAGIRFADGQSLYLNLREYAAALELLADAVAGVRYRFDGSYIDKTCPAEYAALFAGQRSRP
jgi:hypothetical protein